MDTRSDTLSSASRSTTSGSLDCAPFFETERSTFAIDDFFTREERVPSSESYCRVPVPRWASKILRASLSSSRSFSTFAFSALVIALRFLAPCDHPPADHREVVSSSSCFGALCPGRFSVSAFLSQFSQVHPLVSCLLPLFVSVFLLVVLRPALHVVVQAPVVPAGAEQAETRQTAAANLQVMQQAEGEHSQQLADRRPAFKPPTPANVLVPTDPKRESREFCCGIPIPSPVRPDSIVFCCGSGPNPRAMAAPTVFLVPTRLPPPA